MIFKSREYVQKNCRRQRGFSYLAMVVTGVRFKDGIEVNTADQDNV